MTYALLPKGGSLGGWEEALRSEFEEKRQEGLALRDQRVRRRQQRDRATHGGVQQRRPARFGEPVEWVVAEEEVELPARERDAPPAEREIVRRRDLEPRAGQGLAGGAGMGAELVGILGRAESADEPDREATARGAFAERPLRPASPARCEGGPEARRQWRGAGVEPRDLALDRARFPEPRWRIAVDLEELPAPVLGPRPVEAGEEAPVGA
jgi:hypothetical protein